MNTFISQLYVNILVITTVIVLSHAKAHQVTTKGETAGSSNMLLQEGLLLSCCKKACNVVRKKLQKLPRKGDATSTESEIIIGRKSGTPVNSHKCQLIYNASTSTQIYRFGLSPVDKNDFQKIDQHRQLRQLTSKRYSTIVPFRK